jgi:uncharacterized paraquat-inducible protein A
MKKFFTDLAVKFQRFMYGRYGIDQLYRALLWFYLAAIILAMILGRAVDGIFYIIFSAVAWGLFIFAFLRVFSKKTENRIKENENWLKFAGIFKKKFKDLGNRWKFRKTHVFRTCPQCKAVLRMKRVKGKHAVVCPHCSKKFEFRVLF